MQWLFVPFYMFVQIVKQNGLLCKRRIEQKWLKFSPRTSSSSYGAVSSLTTLATMSCQSSLSSVALMSWVGLTLSSKHVHRLSKYFCLCRPLARLPSTFPVKPLVPLVLELKPHKNCIKWDYCRLYHARRYVTLGCVWSIVREFAFYEF